MSFFFLFFTRYLSLVPFPSHPKIVLPSFASNRKKNPSTNSFTIQISPLLRPRSTIPQPPPSLSSTFSYLSSCNPRSIPQSPPFLNLTLLSLSSTQFPSSFNLPSPASYIILSFNLKLLSPSSNIPSLPNSAHISFKLHPHLPNSSFTPPLPQTCI